MGAVGIDVNYPSVVNVRDFGAVGDGQTDDSGVCVCVYACVYVSVWVDACVLILISFTPLTVHTRLV
jgi:hypothetical protein